MERVVEFTGKKVQDAVDEGLKTLGITLDDADIKIIAQGGLFKKAKVEIRYDDGLAEDEQKPAEEPKEDVKTQEPTVKQPKSENKSGAKSAKKATEVPDGEPRWGSAPVKREPTTNPNFGKSAQASEKPIKRKEAAEEVKSENKDESAKPESAQHNKEPRKKNRESVLPTAEQIEEAKEFISELLAKMNIEGKVEITVDEGMRVNLDTEDARVIGHRGEVLDAMQQLISSIINTSHGKFVHVTVDGLGYRDRRKDSLESLARRMADKAVRIHRKVTLDAMNSADRRIIHAALGEREDVFTKSEGHEPARRVVIIPKRNH